uniref:Ribosomal protein S10 n=1 Tax=Ulva expansa TaxID=2293988 RepID=A0A3G2ZPM9_9CHLO|nr:ribosomal protein S10 [Ulva expansa]AYO97777.1 ribosomal protein S10 [Ulva expansa]AYP41055.1 ribosomal protein S10 [Ulva expansa]
MLIKKQHNKNDIANEDQVTELKQPHCVTISTFNKRLYQKGVCVGPSKGRMHTPFNHAEISQNRELIISFRSYPICQAKDIGGAINTIEKLINYLSSLCAKQLHTYFELCTIRSVLYSKVLKRVYAYAHKKSVCASKDQFSPVVLGIFASSYTDLLNCQSIILPRYQKQQSKRKAINHTNGYKSNSKIAGSQLTNNFNLKQNFFEKLQQSYYFDRCFFKLSKQLSSLSAINTKLVQRKNSKKLLTLIRSPFVFKKTREQFSLQTISSHITIMLANAAQKQFLIKNLRLLKLPVEFKVVSRN